MESNPFNKVHVYPGYAAGFVWTWELRPDFHDSAPWNFTVQQSQDSKGPWTNLSPALENVYLWAESGKRLVNKDFTLAFRVLLATADGIYESHVVKPYGDLDRREYLIARDIMRRELLQQRKLAGRRSQIWQKSVTGPDCDNCLDPVSRRPTDSNCRVCMGTGRMYPYHGPYLVWATYSTSNRRAETEASGRSRRYQFEVRMIGAPYMKNDDIVINTDTDKRYRVDAVQHLMEVRGIPVAQTMGVLELPVTDPVYRLGTIAEPESCEYP